MSEITIHNWSECETVNYRLVLVKGSIRQAGIIDKHAYGTIYCTVSSTITTEWKVHEGLFKCLVSLSSGVNHINLVYQNLERTIRIILKYNQTELSIIPVYLICSDHDGRFQSPEQCDNSVESACTRIGLGVQLIQCIFGEKLKENGFPKKSFQIENDIDSTAPLCRIFRSNLPLSYARSWDQRNLWEYFGRELMLSELGSDKKKYLAFLSCTLWDGNRVIGDPALAGGGLALIGTGCLHTWPTTIAEVIPCFTNDTKVQPNLLDNSLYRGTYGGCFSTTLGSVCHEVGHMFNLGHAQTGIMSRGFDYTNFVFTTGQTLPNEQYNKRKVEFLPLLEVKSGEVSAGAKESVVLKASLKSCYNEDDLTHLTHACASILAHHKWFNENNIQLAPIEYDQIRSILRSEAGLKVVQIRADCGAVIKSWELGKKARCKHLVLPRMFLNKSVTLIAIDSNGNIYSQQL